MLSWTEPVSTCKTIKRVSNRKNGETVQIQSTQAYRRPDRQIIANEARSLKTVEQHVPGWDIKQRNDQLPQVGSKIIVGLGPPPAAWPMPVVQLLAGWCATNTCSGSHKHMGFDAWDVCDNMAAAPFCPYAKQEALKRNKSSKTCFGRTC